MVASVLAVGLLTAAGVASAHHGTAGYDIAKVETLDGTVTKYDWSNPHIIVYLDAKDDTGKMRHWSVELAAPLLMERLGWSRNSIKEGDHLVAEVHPSKNGTPVGLGGTASMLLKFTVNGKELAHM
jgi:Family of unknown function (DUF6152)